MIIERKHFSPICGIYLIECGIDSKKYIGMSNNCRRRLLYHRWELRKGIHRNPHLQRAWNKYGEDNFEFDVLEEYPYEILSSMETYWVNLLGSDNRKFGYNIEHPIPFTRGIASEETRLKISKIHSGKVTSDETKRILSSLAKERMKDDTLRKHLSFIFSGKKKGDKLINKKPGKFIRKGQFSVLQYDLNNNFINTWRSLAIASFETNICRSNICNCLKGNRNSAGGFIWKYIEEE